MSTAVPPSGAIPAAQSGAIEPVISTVTSADGAAIGYRRFGRGPGLMLVHGSASSGAHHAELALLLADRFSVIVPDRRGRGLSRAAQSPPEKELDSQIQDIEALIEATGATDLWGLSSGACLLLHAARRIPAIRRIGLYEPPLLRDPSRAALILRAFDAEMARGELGRAMVIAMRGAEMGPAWFRALPVALTGRLVSAGMRQETRRAATPPADPYPSMQELAPTIHDDFAIVAASAGRLDDWRTIGAEVLLMGGQTSPAFLKRALDDLESGLPHARRIELAGVGHEASWNVDRRGAPQAVAPAIRSFFA